MRKIAIHAKITNKTSESFNQYLREVANIELLSVNDEVLLTDRTATGDKKAIDELVRKNLRFVVSVAKHYATPTNLLEDLINEGNIGLMIAAKKYNNKSGLKFITYAVFWIQKLILKYLSENGRTIRLPVNKINGLFQLEKKISELEQKMGRVVDITEIIAEFGTNLENGKSIGDSYQSLNNLSGFSMSSLDQEFQSDDDSLHMNLGDTLIDMTDKSTDHLLIDSDIKTQISKLLISLKPRDRKIMIDFYGLNGNREKTLEEIGEEINLSRERIRQIKEKTLILLKTKLANSTLKELV